MNAVPSPRSSVQSKAEATVEETVVSLHLTRPSTVAEGQTETVTIVSPYPVEVLVQTVARLRRLREVQEREALEG